MPKPENDYRLVLFDAPEDPKAVRDLLCGVTGIHPTEAMQWVAKAPGIWPRPLAEGETRELLDGLFELEVPAEAWRADVLPKLHPIRSVHVAACLESGLRIGGLRGEAAHFVPWPKLELIHAGLIAPDDGIRAAPPPGLADAMATGLNALIFRRPPSSRASRAPKSPRDPVPEVQLVRTEPRIAFRVIADQMNYAYLEDRLCPSTAENFPMFLADLCQNASEAYVTPSTQSLLEGETQDVRQFTNSQVMLDDTTLRLLWSWYRRDRDAQSGTQDD